MAGHSKWAQIKRQKGSEDAKRSKLFAKLSRAISIEARAARGNLSSPSLKNAIERAKKENMPKETIERAVEKGSGAGSENLESVLYEAYGPGGVAVLIEAFTDNRNRTSQEIRHALSAGGGALAGAGAAQWAFVKKEDGWEAKVHAEMTGEEKESLAALLESLEKVDDVEEIYTNAE